ncbi:PREDICTED: uncharacterized protein LOC108763951 isoform X1 [Trachymyrmex cornetzi]|uniref:uncharacterized protein LOC108763951 isoform X1 n=1 Tax=Trachymyrmex cornetzi TaxID=471704 RepID=UPI00084EF313|nr:PREDICTED: uncharacterized protein LOC108763951 isoform X1 [Trachymyrmex cornetzi]
MSIRRRFHCHFSPKFCLLYTFLKYTSFLKKRKLSTTFRHERLMTGGGPASVQPNDPVMEFMDATNQNLDVEIACAFDSTAVFEKEYNVKTDCKSTKGTYIIQDESENEEENVINTIDIYDHSVPAISHNTPLKKRTT